MTASGLAVVQPESGLAVVQGGLTPSKLQLLKDTFCQGATDDEYELAVAVIQRTQLDPFARQIAFIKRWDGNLKREKMTPQITIDGARLLAQRSGNYRGQVGPWWCGDDGVWLDVWLSPDPPAAAKVGVVHADFHEPLYAVARFDAYAARNSKTDNLVAMWAKMPDVMISKCAEALALRRAFPAELSGLYSDDEMAQADNRPQRPTPPMNPQDAEWIAKISAANLETLNDLAEVMKAEGITRDTHRAIVIAWAERRKALSTPADNEASTGSSPVDAEFQVQDSDDAIAATDADPGPIGEDEGEEIAFHDFVESAYSGAMGVDESLQLFAEAGANVQRWVWLLSNAPSVRVLTQVRSETLKSPALKNEQAILDAFSKRSIELKRPGAV